MAVLVVLATASTGKDPTTHGTCSGQSSNSHHPIAMQKVMKVRKSNLMLMKQ